MLKPSRVGRGAVSPRDHRSSCTSGRASTPRARSSSRSSPSRPRRARTRSATCCVAAACRTGSAPRTPSGGEELLAERRPRTPPVDRSSGCATAPFSSTPPTRRSSRAFGVDTGSVERKDFDLVIVGAGPAGLSAAVYARVGGPADARDRARDDRRPGGLELADPQLPRLRPRGHRGRARPARLPAGVGVRGRVRDQPGGGRAAARGRAVRGRSATHGYIATGRALLLATGVTYARIGIPGLEALSGAGVYYGASTVEGLGLGERGRVRDRRRQLGRPGGPAPVALGRPGAAAGARAVAGRGHVAVPARDDRGDAERRGRSSRPRSSTAAAPGAWSGSSCATTRPARRGGSTPRRCSS